MIPAAPAHGPHTAYVDESESVRARDPDTYILAAAVCGATQLRCAREAMRALQLRGQHKVHWRDESKPRREKILATVGRCGFVHVVVVCAGRPGESSERRRRFCLEHLLYELEQRAVERAVLESRGPADDRRDRAMLDALWARKIVTGGLRMQHAAGPTEPLLWVPDAVCGAITHDRLEGATYTQLIRSQLTVIAISSDR